MSEIKFKTMRHIEAVRAFMGEIIQQLLIRSALHDQSKLKPPEEKTFEKYTNLLKKTEFGSNSYKALTKKMKPAISHHFKENRHHAEHFKNGIKGMNLIDIIEMFCDWESSCLRHEDGDIKKSILIMKKKLNLSEELYEIFLNTAEMLKSSNIIHYADES